MRGEFTLKILETVAETAGNVGDGLGAFLSAGYGASLGTLEYEARRHRRIRASRAVVREAEAKMRQRYYMMLYQMRKQGLIIEEKHRRKAILFLTVKGKKKMRELRENLRRCLPVPHYEIRSASSAVVIVAFDVPEKERRKRAWLREALRNFGFHMAQQSLWIGKVKLPKKFLDDLLHLHLVEYVEIFEVTRSGSFYKKSKLE